MNAGTPAALDPARLRDGHGAKWTAVEPDVLPAWVADMDLGIPGPVRARLLDTIDRQDLGYPYWPGGDPVVAAFAERMHTRFGWQPREDRTRVLSDLIQALQIVIEHTTAPGDAIAVHVPAYPPFLAAIHRAGRRIAALPFERAASGWQVDLDRCREIFTATRPRLFLLVNPHNPTGRVFRDDELRGFAEIAVEHGIPVLSDEIHADLAHPPHRHVPFASLDPAVAGLVITATSATKAFNLAGTRCAVVHIGHTPTAEALDRAPLDYFGTPSVLSRIATVAAWRESEDWHRSTLRLLTGNRDRVTAWAAARPGVGHHPPEATYLSWLDLAGAGLASAPAAHLLRAGRVHLSAGDDFVQHTGVDAASYVRLNFATTPPVLSEILRRIDVAMASSPDA